MKKFILCLLISIIIGVNSSGTVWANNNEAAIMEQMKDPSFWHYNTQSLNSLIMTPNQVANFSQQIKNTDGTDCVDLSLYPEVVTKEYLDALLKYLNAPPQISRYKGKVLLDENYYKSIWEKCNTASIQNENPVKFGFVIREATMRTIPSDDPSYSKPDDFELDRNFETVLKVWEKVAVIHTSSDKNWYLVQSYSYVGWVRAVDIALTDKATLSSYDDKSFLVVTANRIMLDYNTYSPSTSRLELTMGTRLPLANTSEDIVDGVGITGSHLVLLPISDSAGNFVPKIARIPLNHDVNIGYLAYNYRNIIDQAYKMLGERYGWGGMFKARDCSSFIKDIYLTMGIELPRNADSQTKIKSFHVDVKTMPVISKQNLIASQPPGTLLEMEGHILLYLGQIKGVPYVIHALYKHDNTIANSVIVSDLSLKLADGTTFLSAIRNINVIK